MTRALLLLLFFIMLAGRTLGLDLSLAPGLSVKNALLYLIFVGIAIDMALRRDRHFEIPSVTVPFFVLVFYAIFTWLTVLLVVDYPGYDLMISAITIKSEMVERLFVLLVFLYGLRTARDAVGLIKAMIWIVMLGNMISVMDALNLPDLGLIDEREDGRIGGVIGESNQYAALILMFLPGTVALVVLESGWRRVLALVGTGASVLALLMTASRGGIAGAILGSLFALLLLRRHVSTRALMIAVAGGVVTLIGILIIAVSLGYGELLYERIIGQSFGRSDFDVTSGRTVIWTSALAEMASVPISLVTGFGWDAYRTFNLTGAPPHNEYLGVFFNLGLIGLSLMLISIMNIFRIARFGIEITSDTTESYMLFAFVMGYSALLVAIIFVDLYLPWVFVWAYVGATMRLAVSVAGQSEPAYPPSAEHAVLSIRRA